MISLQKQIQWMTRVQLGLLGTTVLGSALFYFAVFVPTRKRIEQIQTNIATTDSAIRVNVAAARDLESLRKQVDELQHQIDNSKQLKTQPELPKFIREVTQFSHNSGLMRFGYMPNEKLSLKYCSELPIALEFSGPFNDVAAFVKQAEGMNRMTRTRSLFIRTRDARNGIVDVKLSMSLFYSED